MYLVLYRHSCVLEDNSAYLVCMRDLLVFLNLLQDIPKFTTSSDEKHVKLWYNMKKSMFDCNTAFRTGMSWTFTWGPNVATPLHNIYKFKYLCRKFGILYWELIAVYKLAYALRPKCLKLKIPPFSYHSNSTDTFFCIGFNVPFNKFQVISGRCLLVTEGMLTTL